VFPPMTPFTDHPMLLDTLTGLAPPLEEFVVAVAVNCWEPEV
jgi:hypothetical protein